MSDASQESGQRRAPNASSAELDALLESLQTDLRTPRPATPSPPAAPTAERPTGDLTARRVQALVRAFDVLHKQVGAIAAQGETISKVAEAQAQDGKAIADLQRNMRYLRAIVIQQLQQSSPAAAANLPPIQIKLVVGHLVEQYQQAERDAAVLVQWSMLFAGLAVGMALAAAVSAFNQQLLTLAIFVTSGLLTLAVAFIFAALARTARTRAATARRTMDESTLLRSVGINSVGVAE